MTAIRAKLFLVLFGASIGTLCGYLAFLAWGYLHRGSQFESIDELQRAMLREDAPPSEDGAELRALIAPHPNEKIIYDLKPGLDLRFMRADVKTNSCGMRDVERTVEKKVPTFRIALLGDSFAFGWGVEFKEGFGQVLERELQRYSDQSSGLKIEVLNFGVPGYSTFQEVALFEDRVLAFQPDEILLLWVENDLGLPFFVRNIGQPGSLLLNNEFVQMVRRAANPEFEQEQLRYAGLDPNTSLRHLGRIARANAIRLTIAPNPKEQWHSDQKKLWVLKENRRLFRVIDWVEQFSQAVAIRGIEPKDLTLTFDPHPSPLKHQIMGELLAGYFADRV
jgi:hypothetical protein